MTLAPLKNLITVARDFGQFLRVKNWREMFARGDDVGGAGGIGACPNPAQKSAWVFACLRLIAGQGRSLPLSFYEVGRDGKQRPFLEPETAAFWSQPAETASGPLSQGDFLELTLTWINLTGQAFWILDDSWLTPRGVKSPILLARPDRMNPIMQGDMLIGWMYTDGAKSRYALVPEQVIRPRILNPYADEKGLAPLEAARVAVDADYAAGVFARNVASSNGDQGVYVVAKGGQALSDEQRTQIIAQLRQKAELSKKGIYRPAFLTADVSVEDPKIKTVDSAFVSGRQESRHEIFVAFGVPPSMSDRMDSYSVGAASDRYRLIEETCIPLSRRICEAIAQVERKRSGRTLLVEQEWSQHPVMAQIRQERLKASAELWKTGVPWDVLSQVNDLQMPKFPGSDRAWLPLNLEAVENKTTSTEDDDEETPPPEPKEGEDDEDQTKAALAKSGAAIHALRGLIDQLAKTENNPPAKPMQKTCKQGGAGCGCGSHAKAGEGEGEGEESQPNPERLKLWQRHMQLRRPSEKLFLGKVRRAIMSARADTLAKLEQSAKALEGVRQRGVLDLLFDGNEFEMSMVRLTKPAHEETIKQSLFQFAEEIGSDDPWEVESQKVLNFLTNRENRIRDASREIFNDIKSELETGLAAGESNAQLAERVKSAFNGIASDRAEMIAATEVTAAYGFSRHDAMQGLGIGSKQWLSAQDGRVRDTHRLADGQTVAMDEPFIIGLADGGSEELMHPGDVNGSAENVIRCRCVEIPVMD